MYYSHAHRANVPLNGFKVSVNNFKERNAFITFWPPAEWLNDWAGCLFDLGLTAL